MSAHSRLVAANIPPVFWPPLNERGEVVSRWQGRNYDNPTTNSFQAFRQKAEKSAAGINHLNRHHNKRT